MPSPRADVFLDTNVLIYAARGGGAVPEKRATARRIVATEEYGTSAQVLAEFYVNAIGKGERPLTPDEARRWVVAIAKKPCQAIDERVVLAGIDHAARYGISYWDGAIVAAAERLGAGTLYTEDLGHGRSYGSVTAIDPFLDPSRVTPSDAYPDPTAR